MTLRVLAEGVGVRFLFDRQRRPVTPLMARVRGHCSETWGLRGLDLSIEAGDSVALIGPNGAGKTTLLRVIAGVMDPDEGRLEVNGRVGSVLSVQAGLLPKLTGRENGQLLGVLAGLSRAEARAGLDALRERSGLDDSFERPVSAFSQGMTARLGFSVIEHVDPAILLLDEVHEALDHEFRAIVEARARHVVERGGVVVAAGHDHAELGRLCRRAVQLDQGAVKRDGRMEDVVREYLGDGVGASAKAQ